MDSCLLAKTKKVPTLYQVARFSATRASLLRDTAHKITASTHLETFPLQPHAGCTKPVSTLWVLPEPALPQRVLLLSSGNMGALKRQDWALSESLRRGRCRKQEADNGASCMGKRSRSPLPQRKASLGGSGGTEKGKKRASSPSLRRL